MNRDDGHGGEWQRLDPRMLLVHPVRELLRFLPALLGLFLAGTASGGVSLRWQLLAVAVPVAVGLMRYLTTSFRIDAERVELRRGLVSRHRLSTRLDRVRTVDLTSSPVQRVLGLSTVRIGTGTASTSDDDQVDLDGLPTHRARLLRHDLLQRARPASPDPTRPPDERVVLVLDPRWARYAPLTSAGVVLAAGVVGVGSQLLEQLSGGRRTGPGLDLTLDRTELLMVLPITLAGLAATVTALAVLGYLVTNWGFTLRHSHRDGSWHLRRGLLTTRETTLDAERLSGVSVGEPLGLRLAGASRLSAIVTGLGRHQGSSELVPPAPRDVVLGVGTEVLGAAGPLRTPLVTHGPRAAARRWTRALTPALLGSAVLVAAVVSGATGWLLLPALLLPAAAAGLAADRARSLGHALSEGHLVARSGSLLRQRQALAVGDVIGWTFRATWLQRRAGLTSLVATTAGGPQSVTVLDVPEARAVGLAEQALPALVGQFTTRQRLDTPG